jgi:hypothetical protein
MTDEEKIADALRAGPRFITDNATIRDWPSTPGGEYRVLRQGTNEWTCLPALPGYSHDEPRCFDAAFMQWMKESLAGREPRVMTAQTECLTLRIFHTEQTFTWCCRFGNGMRSNEWKLDDRKTRLHCNGEIQGHETGDFRNSHREQTYGHRPPRKENRVL